MAGVVARTVAQIESDIRHNAGVLMIAREFRKGNPWAERDYRDAQETSASLHRELRAARRREA